MRLSSIDRRHEHGGEMPVLLPLRDVMRPQPGQLIHNKYRLIRLIGDGGMGSVYEARHQVLGTSVALKFLHPELSRRSGLVERFLQEARVSARIQSTHVVRVTDVDQTPSGLAFIVMEYLEGRSLQTLYEDLYRAGERLSYGDALDYAVQMMEGVEAAHAEGIVHRDLKPDNVMITKDRKGRTVLKILDFGIAKLKVSGALDRGLTRPGVVMGTPEYMAPEQAFSADQVDARADIFSLGVMTFEMLAGRRPVGGDEAHQIAAQYLTGQIARLTDLLPSCPPELANAIHRAMAANAQQRFGSVSEMRAAVEPFANAANPQQRTPSTPPGVAYAVTPAGTPHAPPAAAIPAAVQPAAMPAAAPPAPAVEESPPPTNSPSDLAAAAAMVGGVPKTIPPAHEDWGDASGPPPGVAAAENGSAVASPSAPPPRADLGDQVSPHAQTAEGIGETSHPIIRPVVETPKPAAVGGGTVALQVPVALPISDDGRPAGDATVETPPLFPDADAKPATSPSPSRVANAGTEVIATPRGGNGASVSGASPVAASIAGSMPATQTGAPLGAEPNRTSEGSPLGEPFAATLPVGNDAYRPASTEGYDPYQPRAGGTAVGQPMTADVHPGMGGYAGPMDGYGAMPRNPGYAVEAHAPVQTQRKARAGMSVFTILFLATAIAGAVVGGIYVANEVSASNDSGDEDKPIKTPKSKGTKKVPSIGSKTDPEPTAAGPIPPPVEPDPPAEPPPATPPPATPPPSKPPPTSPPPGSSTPTRPPPPATPPPFILPSSLPGIPGIPGFEPIQPPPSPPPDQPPVNPPPQPNNPPPPPPDNPGRPKIKIPGIEGKRAPVDPSPKTRRRS